MEKRRILIFLGTIFCLGSVHLFSQVPKARAWWDWEIGTQAIRYTDGAKIPLPGANAYLCSSGCRRSKSGNNCSEIEDTGSDGWVEISGGRSFSCGGCGGWCHACVRIPDDYDFPPGVAADGHWEHPSGDNNTCTCNLSKSWEDGDGCQSNTDTEAQNLDKCGVFYWVSDAPQPPNCESLTAEPNSGEPPLEVSFRGKASDPDGVVAGYTLDFGDGETEQGTNDSTVLDFSITHTYRGSGTYTAILTICDDTEACINGDQCKTEITVSEVPNKPPICESLVANPQNGEAPLEVQFRGRARDNDGIVASYKLDFGDGEVEEGGNESSTLDFTTYHTYGPEAHTATLTICDEDRECANGPQCTAELDVNEKFLNCESLVMTPESPGVGEQVTFTCSGSSYLGKGRGRGAPIVRVMFKIYYNYELVAELETTDIIDLGNGSYSAIASYTIEKTGHYGVSSNVCLSPTDEALCTDFSPPPKRGKALDWIRRTLSLDYLLNSLNKFLGA